MHALDELKADWVSDMHENSLEAANANTSLAKFSDSLGSHIKTSENILTWRMYEDIRTKGHDHFSD